MFLQTRPGFDPREQPEAGGAKPLKALEARFRRVLYDGYATLRSAMATSWLWKSATSACDA